ncbi:DUF1203 domain-containing protein [Lysobacter hankyongensis]|uniref:DUF1203 domain-containing protein n=1 Tax=Lysobacter hankyongensis TaxID=1176535 RepID=A0ABP9B7P0_9GAMM
MSFQIHALPADSFAPLFELSDDALRGRGIRRVVADGRPVYPCRVSLQDAVEGETLLLLPHEHHAVDTPYRASGPIYVREAATRTQPGVDDVPALLRTRLLSLRAYDARGMMVWADVVDGAQVEAGIAQLFAIERVAYLHIHYAKPGCYACRVERA